MTTQLQLPFDDDRPRDVSVQTRASALTGPASQKRSFQDNTPSPMPSRRQHLLSHLRRLHEGEVEIVLHDNRSTMISAGHKGGTLTVRLHHMFLQAPDAVIEQVARFALRPDRRSRSVVNAYIEDNAHLISAQGSRPSLRTRGRHHDLRALFDRLNDIYFDGQVYAELGYGEAGSPKRRRRRSIKLGSYDRSARRIVIHPALDQAEVPAVFVEYVIFHEMLHQLFPTRSDGDHLVFHPPELRRAERAFAGRKAALMWYRQNEDVLLTYRPERAARRPVKEGS